MLPTGRRYDIDWLRVIAIGLLIIYHIAIGFQPWGVLIGFIQNNEPLEAIWIPMSMLNIWRIPLLFFISGMGVCFAIGRRNWKQLLFERSQRILLPFVFGIFAVVPLHVFLWQHYYHQSIEYIVNPIHLWFLGNIFIYVLVLSPLFFYLKKKSSGPIRKWLSTIFKNPIGLFLMTIPFMVEAIMINPEAFEIYAMNFHGFWLGLLAFLSGFCFIYSGVAFWQTVLKWRWLFFTVALSLYLFRLMIFDLKGPNYLMAFESNMWIFTIFGFGYKYLNRPSKALNYLSQAAYPVYIIHMIFLYLGSSIFFPLNLDPAFKFVLTNLFTVLGCFLTYELIIVRVNVLRPLFGLKVPEYKDKKSFKSMPSLLK
ncbi:acyltransferase family protein [Fulvivirgaceae bacterium BMA10]|uniref:Acyltransferase family protein n=1 Tax=Splendidivirga corallicola TaxID=3051826 RepID=A0ABT8KWY2_9BACT|nr:acyltransferase family protein [Fulvivirgaceae bacterium BMA10]